jgi:alcohol dehydrogenase
MVNHPPSESPGAFDAPRPPRLVFGCGAIERLGELARELGGTRVLLVTDPGLVAAGHVARAEAILARAGCEVARFADARENPTPSDIERCRVAAAAHRTELFVGFGGGTALDTAKGANFVLTNGGSMQDYWGVGKARLPLLPLIAVPTTAGTGSETQSFALISQEGSHRKMACGDPKAMPAVALLDPELTRSMPPRVTALTALDTLAHAVETRVTRVGNALSALLARDAFRLAFPALPKVLRDPEDLAARGDLLLASAFAGSAIEASMLGGAHALANPLTARFDVVHGQAVGTMLPHVVRWNAEHAPSAAAYRELASCAGLASSSSVSDREAAYFLAQRLDELLPLADLPRTLQELGVRNEHLDQLAADAAAQWTAGFNPRPLGVPELRALYVAASAR